MSYYFLALYLCTRCVLCWHFLPLCFADTYSSFKAQPRSTSSGWSPWCPEAAAPPEISTGYPKPKHSTSHIALVLSVCYLRPSNISEIRKDREPTCLSFFNPAQELLHIGYCSEDACGKERGGESVFQQCKCPST